MYDKNYLDAAEQGLKKYYAAYTREPFGGPANSDAAEAAVHGALYYLSLPEHQDGRISVLKEFSTAISELSGGSNAVIADDTGFPSVMVYVKPVSAGELLPVKHNGLHPAFTAGGRTENGIYVSKYLNFIRNGRAYSLPFADPCSGIGFDDALTGCRVKGNGWTLTNYALRAMLSLSALKRGRLPRGNNNSGADFFYPEERGYPTADGRTAGGSGPLSWSDDYTPNGIYDLNGNQNEWDAGLCIVDGEIRIITDEETLFTGNCGSDSESWRAVTADGELVRPGSKGALRYSGIDNKIILSDRAIESSFETGNCAFGDIEAEIIVPDILKLYTLFPTEKREAYGAGWRWVRNRGECFPLSGGAYSASNHAGVFFTGMTYPRTTGYRYGGFRAIYAAQP